ncbi:MAG: DUF3618 domain-containing protein [Erythrobacter sp.]|jgi:hypothetical protein|nr:DUF3618 domain-containing protein [Erythrobacter sp.]
MTDQDNRSPEEIQRDIRETQDEMSRTVNQLGNQFTPRNLVNALFDKAEDNDVQARQIIDGARRNPLALGLLSAGAIWLVSDYDARPSAFTSRNNSDSSDNNTLPDLDTSYDHDHRSYVAHMNAIERRDGEDDMLYQRRRDDARANYLMIERGHEEDERSYRQRLDEATEGMRARRDEMADKARRAREDAGQRLAQAKSQVKQRSRKGASLVSGMYQDNPMIGGLAAAFVAMIAGSAAPATQRERQAFGEHGERIIDTAKDKAQQMGEQARAKKDELVTKADKKVRPDGTGTRAEMTTA